jgi:hypothetical protein
MDSKVVRRREEDERRLHCFVCVVYFGSATTCSPPCQLRVVDTRLVHVLKSEDERREVETVERRKREEEGKDDEEKEDGKRTILPATRSP